MNKSKQAKTKESRKIQAKLRTKSGSFYPPPEAEIRDKLIVRTFGEALLNSFFAELQATFADGGIDAVDETIDNINEFLKQLSCQYRLGPGAISEQQANGNETALGIPVYDAFTETIISTYWIMMGDGETDDDHACGSCAHHAHTAAIT